MKHKRSFAAVAFALGVAGCENFKPPVGPDGGEAALNRTAPRQAGPYTSDDEFARAARAEAPGFAGFYLQADGTPVVRLVDPAQRGAAERYLATQLATLGRGRLAGAPQRPIFRAAAYDFAQLKAWSDQVHALLSRGDVYSIDVDEVENRVLVGVRDAAAVSAVRAQAARMGVPAAALHVQTQPAPEMRITVRDRNSTMQGGIQIAFGGGLCTEGFNAQRNGQWIFVTNSHCTNTYLGYDGGTLYQNTVTSGNAVGTESNDRGLYACAGTGTSCRRADAAYITQNGSRSIGQGVVARTSWATGGPGGLDIIGQYNIVARYAGSTPVGTYLDKTGRTSGTTYGQVTNSCVTIGNFRCQDISKVWSEPGDSGSPMLVWTGGDNAELQGILWGGPNNDWTTTYSSRLAGIEQDLGALSALCRPGYGC